MRRCLDRGLGALLWPGSIMLIRRPWPYVIHHLHFMNMYRLYIARHGLYREDVSIWNWMILKYLYIPYDIHWKVKWTIIEKYEKKVLFIVGLGTVQPLKTRPWPYVIHHLHFMNMYRLYIAWYLPTLLMYVGCINGYFRNKTLFLWHKRPYFHFTDTVYREDVSIWN
jgi:hypothetical protein